MLLREGKWEPGDWDARSRGAGTKSNGYWLPVGQLPGLAEQEHAKSKLSDKSRNKVKGFSLLDSLGSSFDIEFDEQA